MLLIHLDSAFISRKVRDMLRIINTCLLVCLAVGGHAQTVSVPNTSFESGTDKPEGWTLSGNAGVWESTGHTGNRCVSVTGNGETSNYWATSGMKLDPGKTYRLSFWVKGENTSGGCVISGPSFCNRDFGAGDKWERLSYVFLTPKDTKDSYLRFGQWMVKGKVYFDDVTLVEVTPVSCREGLLVLGDGESIEGNHYSAEPALGGEGANYSWMLADSSCGFNSNRWVFAGSNYLVYRHDLGDYAQRSAKVTVNVGYYQSGKCLVEASGNGRDYTPIGEVAQREARTLTLPENLFPAPCVYVRLRSVSGGKREGDSAPGAFQVHGYTYEAELDRKVDFLQGGTRYLEITRQSTELSIAVNSLGPLRPAPNSRAQVEVTNKSETPKALKAILAMGKESFSAAANLAAQGKTVVEIPYELSASGEIPLTLSIAAAGQTVFEATTSFTVPQLYAGNYGYRLSDSSSSLGLWWCEATYKVSRERSLPKFVRAEIVLSAAKNEYEPFQLVLRPSKRQEAVTVEVSDFRGQGGKLISKQNVQVDLVEYVKVTHPTDSEGIAGWWPDPLPHYTGAFPVEAERNQPVWFTVHVPENAVAGDYVGTVTVETAGQKAKVPVKLHVWNFVLPKETHIRSGFGVSSWSIQRYHNLTTPGETQGVMEQYHRAFADHRICPYTPMRPIRVKFAGRSWMGGEVSSDEHHEGAQSLQIVDNTDKSVVVANYGTGIPVDAMSTYKLGWWCKASPGQKYMVTVDQRDEGGNWRSGHNRDVVREGNGEWKYESAELRFDEGTVSTGIALRPTVWTEDGRFTGTAWFDDVSFSKVGEDTSMVADSGFEAKPADIKVEHDFTEFDRDAHHFLDELGYNSFALPVIGLGGGTFYERTAGELAGLKSGTPEYEALFVKYLKPIEDHLKQKGWLNKAYVYWFDEPSPNDYDFVRAGMKTLGKAAPGICKFLTVKPVKELFGDVDLWCVPVGAFSPEEASARQKAGEEIWWYLCCGPHAPWVGLFIDHPAIDFRMWLWMSWKWNVSGILIWETTYWTSPAAYPKEPQDPWEDPMSYVSGYGTPAGTKSFWGNGDGRLFYPPNRTGAGNSAKYLEGPVNSIRVELMREGIEDFEYFYLLKQRLKGSPPRSRGSLLDIPESIITDPTHFTKDPQLLYAHREKVARAIEQLN